MNTNILFPLLLCISIAYAYSYNDKCYRFDKNSSDQLSTSVQYYFSQKGLPLGVDMFITTSSKSDNEPIYSYCFHSELSECTFKESTYSCQRTIESAWFRIWDAENAKPYASGCNAVFEDKYANVMKYGCKESSILDSLKGDVGKVDSLTIPMGGKAPSIPAGYKAGEDCVWEYEILGLMSKVTLGIIGLSIVIVLILAIAVLKCVQNKQNMVVRNMNNSLIEPPNSMSV